MTSKLPEKNPRKHDCAYCQKKVSLHICLEFSKIVKVIFHLRKSMVNNNKQMSSIQMRIWQVKILLLLRNTKVHTKVTSNLSKDYSWIRFLHHFFNAKNVERNQGRTEFKGGKHFFPFSTVKYLIYCSQLGKY